MGEGGFDGWLEWLGTTNTTGFVALIKSMIPHQVNLRTEKGEPEKYRTVEEIEADLRAGGYSDEKIAFLIEDLRPQNKVSAVNAEPKTPKMKTLAGANGGAGQGGDYLDTLTRTEPSGM